MSVLSEMAVMQAREPCLELARRRPLLAPPAPPSPWSVLKVMLRKHLYIAKKRRRILTSVWPALMYGGITVFLFYVFEGLNVPEVRATLMAVLVPVYIVLAVQGALQCAIVEIVSEKESKMKVVQEIYGLSTTMYWISWGGYFLIVSSVCIALLYSLFTLGAPVLSHSSFVLVLIILVCSYVQQLEFAAITAVFFDKVQTASTVASFLSLAMMLLAASLQGWLRDEPKLMWYAAGLLPTVNVFNGFSAILWQEALYYCDASGCSHGLNMRSVFASELCLTPYSIQDPCQSPTRIFSAGESIALMLVDVVLYAFLAWWLDQVWQGEYGRAKPLTFCFDPAYICPGRRQRRNAATEEQLLQVEDGHAVQRGRQVALSLCNLRKVFPGGKVAVDGMDLEVFGGEIFALLGHNGAGKTTCMNCVVGLIPMTSGEASVNGCDVRCDIEGARRQMSICPQDNPLYDVFTVRQHLVFFASLRGVSQDMVSDRIFEVISSLGMPEKIDDLCTSLSGGQKRRLWVATALLGETPLVFLDEPTSGMDPSSRRELWNLLLQMKVSGRSVLFTTHYLEEADVLADRKAVLARGRVQACGTSRDLKLQFGLGYHLQVFFDDGIPSSEDARSLMELVKHYIASATEAYSSASPGGSAPATRGTSSANSHAAAEAAPVCFTLPFQEVAHFGPLLLALDEQKEALHIKTYNISMTTLEEVFMALGEQAEREAIASQGVSENADFRSVEPEPDIAEPGRPEASARRSTRAMMRLRWRLLFGNRRAVYSAVILPAIFNVLSFTMKGQGASAEGNDTMIAIYPPMAFGISIISFTMQLIQDKEWKCKHTAMAQGLSVKSYWSGTFLANYAVSLLNSLILVVAIQLENVSKLNGNGFLLIVIQAFIYPVGLLVLAYNYSLLFSKVEVAVKVLPLSNLFLGTIPTICVQICWNLGGIWPNVARGLHIVMSVINPVYALPGMMVVMIWEEEMSTLAYFNSWSAVPLYGSLLSCLIFGSNLLWQDARSYSARPGAFQAFANDRKDEDVLAEELRVAGTSAGNAALEEAARYQDLSHTYRTKVQRRWRETHAVRGISLGIRSGECFGLLGPNGAGKTTTLAVLTGEVRPPTAGQVHIYGNDVTTADGLAEAYKLLGVCPQVDPLWETITGREHLLFYGRIKGVPEASLAATADALLHRLGFDSSDGKKQTSTYSGGMKRKLSLAIALIGRSPLLFLDEPSAAVDAGAKRHLWKVIRLRGREQTVVLTTHSMEEAEALCNRIAIQVRGQLRCLGTPVRIKDRYGSGYQLELFCQREGDAEFSEESSVVKAQELSNFVTRKLSAHALLLEHHSGRFLFQLPPLTEASLSLGKVFLEVQSNMEMLGVSHYSLTQPSLEQVFVRFAREQEEEAAQESGPSSSA
eukprot:TRINITY_DN5797_c0_g1_i2.p1 TRINITY_DN5797_c0_g1~~TRINITY_DN5797_c0_g1_i2.p1  ORF type:complete len:1395 (+),score=291.85 TRINITY_DN5797_c0_g1_i2:23-4207(+)